MSQELFFKARKLVKVEVAVLSNLINEIITAYQWEPKYSNCFLSTKDLPKHKIVEKIIGQYIESNQEMFDNDLTFSINKRFKSYFEVIQKQIVENSKNPVYTMCEVSIGTLRIMNTTLNRAISDFKVSYVDYPKSTTWELFLKEAQLSKSKEYLNVFHLYISGNSSVEMSNNELKYTGSIRPMSLKSFTNFPIQNELKTNFHIINLTGKGKRDRSNQLLLIVDFTFNNADLCFGSLNILVENTSIFLYKVILKRKLFRQDAFRIVDFDDRIEVDSFENGNTIKEFIDSDYFKTIELCVSQLNSGYTKK